MALPVKANEDLLADLAAALDIPVQRYQAADRSYKSLCAWLERPESRFARVNINVYTQGSFRLGTAIRPISGEEHYDLDVVCEFAISKQACTQKSLHDDLGYELKRYAARYQMEAPSPWRRCWTLNYSDNAQFHMDILPCVPDGQRQRQLREARSVSLAYVDRSVSITDSDHPNYTRSADNWPISNPNGYADWFYERMKPAFELKRRAMMLIEAKADVSEIPAFRVKTPLQSSIQILKRHRDIRFSEQPEGRPTSIVISTLAAHAYQQETTIAGALLSILERMDSFIERRGSLYWIENPSDPRENFADRWNDEPEQKDIFYDWLETARTDFKLAAEQREPAEFINTLAPRMGRSLVEAAAARHLQSFEDLSGIRQRTAHVLRRILDAPHRKPLVWPKVQAGTVEITSATAKRAGFRSLPMTSDGMSIAKGSSLHFTAQTNVPRPYKVYWQIVNTGSDAIEARDLRGRFEEISIEAGALTKKETARYGGSHSIECFIVKDGYCAAQSGPFIVNVG